MAMAGISMCPMPCKQMTFCSSRVSFQRSEKLSSVSRNGGQQLVFDLNPNGAPLRIVYRNRPQRRRGIVNAKSGQDWSDFMHELTDTRKQSHDASSVDHVRPTAQDFRPDNQQGDQSHQEVGKVRSVQFSSALFAKIEAPSRNEAPPSDVNGNVQPNNRLIERGSLAVSNASRRAAESAAEASETASKLARYARRRYQERTGGIYTGTTIADDEFPLRQPSRGEMFVLGGLVIAIVSAFAWRWQAMQDARGTRFISPPAERPRDPNRPKLPAPVPPMADLGANPRQKESAEWLNMVLSKIWTVYQRALESWIVQSLQPAFDDLAKPAWVGRVIIKQFYLGEEPITIRSVQRRVSRRANDLQYNLGLRYSGGARMLLNVPIQSGPIKVDMPVGVRRLDLDAELWIKIRLVPMEPYVGSFTWAFANKPKINLVLAPFRFVNLMNIPLVSTFLLKLLTEDLPRNFELPNKVLIDLMKDRVSGPSPQSETANLVFDAGFKGELNVTLIEAESLPVWGLGFLSNPHCILTIGQQEVRSKRDSDTSVRGKSGNPVWNQDFFFLIEDPVTQKLVVQVRDSPTTLKLDVAKGAIDLANLPDLEPVDVWIDLAHSSGFGPSNRSRPAGRVLLRLTYKSYVEDDDEGPVPMAAKAKSGRTTLVEGLPEFDVGTIPDLVTNDIPIAVAEGVQKGIDALPEEIPAAIQKGLDAIPPEIPEAMQAGSERASDDMGTVQNSLAGAIPASVKDSVKGIQESATDFVSEGIANAVENLGFGANDARVKKVEPSSDIREVAVRDKSGSGPHDFAVYRDEADVSENGDVSKDVVIGKPHPPPLKLTRTSSKGSTFSVAKEGTLLDGGEEYGVSGKEDDVSGEEDVPVTKAPGKKVPVGASSAPVASEALERNDDVPVAKGPGMEIPVAPGVTKDRESPGNDGLAPGGPIAAATNPAPAVTEIEDSRPPAGMSFAPDVSVRETAGVDDVSTGRRGIPPTERPLPGAKNVSIGRKGKSETQERKLGGDDAVDFGETVEDVKQQLQGALETLKEKTIGGS